MPNHGLDESARLERFFSKLLSETLFMGCDAVSFSPQNDQLTVSLRKAKQELKSISIKGSWLQPSISFLSERFCTLLATQPIEAFKLGPTHEDLDFESTIKLSDSVLAMRVRSSTGVGRSRSLTLDSFRVIPQTSFADVLGVLPYARMAFDAVLSSENGVVVLASPNNEQLRRSQAVFLSGTSISILGDLADTAVRADLPAASQDRLVAVTTRADDSVDALLKLRELGCDLQTLRVRGAVCLGLSRKVCPHCARKTVMDKKLSSQLPSGLLPEAWDGYVVGRGCAQCGERGLQGYIGVLSVALVDEAVMSLLREGASQEQLLKLLYPRGTRSLLEDGVKKLLEASVTIEELLSIAPTLPQVYAEYIARQTGPIQKSTTSSTNNAPLFEPATTAPREKPLLLVVEDDIDQRSILEMVFKSSGFDVACATNGAEGLARAEEQRPDLIVTDLMMPVMDGLEFVTKIRSHNTLKNTPMLVLTVVSDGDKEYALLDVGADDYCEKTVQRKILLKRIDALLRRSRGGSL